ncbi:MAG: helix-turn-helix transcriptional regulator [Planctomycetota bacterium]
MTEQTHDDKPSHEWLLKMAEAEDRCGSVSVGGMAHDVGLLESQALPEAPRVFGRLIEYARRAKGLSVERLAEVADVDLGELVAIEQNEGPVPSARTVYRLGLALNLSSGKLMELAGLAQPQDDYLSQAAVRFAARSEPNAALSPEERAAYEEFVKVLVESSERRD